MIALAALSFNGPPTTGQQLDQRVAAVADALGVAAGRARVLVASLVVAQMLPADTMVKGGIGVKLRLGEVGTRATRDVDVVTRDRSRFLTNLTARLAAGWGTVPPSKGAMKKDPAAPQRIAFTGKARLGKQARPVGVPPVYVMEPYAVTLHFLGTPWAAIPVEVAHDEVDGLEYADLDHGIDNQVAAVAAALGFGALKPVPLISLEQQIAQKIHAATQPGSERAHDLVDLQLLWFAGSGGGSGLDLPLLAQLCRRTFDYRKDHSWPPVPAMSSLLEPAYQAARAEAGLAADVAETLAGALEWLTARIADIHRAGQ